MSEHTKNDTYQNINKYVNLIEDSYINFNANIHTNPDTNKRKENDDTLENLNNNDDDNDNNDNDNNNDDNYSSSNISSDNNDKNVNDNVENNNNTNKGKKKKKNLEKYKALKKDNDIKLAIKVSLQYLLKNQPFPVKRDDLLSVVNNYVPNCNSNIKRKVLLKLLKKYVKEILALKLLTLTSNTKTEYVLSQNILYKQHNDFLYSKLDHNIRGFIIFLIPFFKIFHNKLPLNYLLNELDNLGYKTSKSKEEILKIMNAQNLFTNIVNNINLSKEIIDPIDYIIYSKKLSYIDFANDQYDEYSLDGFYCIPTLRFEYEVNTKYYINELLDISNKHYQLKDLYVIFEDNHFVNLNYNNI
ncbi:hypothetical protein YYC_05662 [Plasmodium yoelii 17X]|uniref:Uncharacterized protein n=4 Tax=Plasmodium yoelii TaxID=5861 RepID=A0AAE9X0V8_PLAYO|nr:conserved protein, unknown function [Plasmodium yoelii]EAA19746.1 hypothetical protein [Plasmodium yoelii yoelii]ETB56199.1 hypothetical protein YYC_05662 [Plasmodium yoelii 17X]WBY59843.1 hypothetical protein Py17XNL_001303039 [Plasmodium yoelii yoelii]CDU19794.1 conserved Plasmodium protein, unknown function [Plasmodium yoelii]VTZ80551.1 conserved protein, unknown function [Plasmodium yoelii]|eukprot:XP_728181.1 conserved protein, unknown function [Plasmodium yoelii]